MTIKKEFVFKDFTGFPLYPFNQINFNKLNLDNQKRLLNNGFSLVDENTYFRQSDSTTIFADDTFQKFIVYMKGKSFVNQSQLLHDLIKNNSYQFNGTPNFTEFKVINKQQNYYSITFFKWQDFIRLKYEFQNYRG